MNTYGYQQQYGAINRPVYGTTATPLQQPNSATQRIRPVASLDEVRAMNIDFDGSVFYFPDYANRKIYTKQINMDGTASINMYELKEIPQQQTPIDISSFNFITRDEFDKAILELKNSLQSTAASTSMAAAPKLVQEEPKHTAPLLNF